MIESAVTIDGVKIHFVSGGEASSGDTPTVLYVHGNLGSWRWFERSMDLVGARTVALDMPNFGRSDRIESHSIPGYGAFIASFVDQLIGAPVVLVGHSLGGAVAMWVATARSGLVRGLLLVDSSPVDGLVTPEAYHPAIEAYRSDEAQLRIALKTVVPTLEDDAWFDTLVEDARRMKAEAYIGHAVELGKADFTAVAGSYRGPALVVRGGLDALVTDEMARRTAEAFGASVRDYPSVGHSIMVEAPDEFSRLVTEFVSSLRGSGSGTGTSAPGA